MAPPLKTLIMNQDTTIRWLLKPAITLLALAPIAVLLWDIRQSGIDTDTVEQITQTTGNWGLRLLLAALSITPLRRITRWHGLIRTRRLLGLLAFTYALLHLSTYVFLAHGGNIAAVIGDVGDHPRTLLGLLALVILIPLAATSSNAMVKRLGGQTWQKLHQLAYLAATAAVVHSLLPLQSSSRQAQLYALWLMLLLAYRLWWILRRPPPPPRRPIIPITRV